MWPWEHAMFAYVIYSLYLRGRYRTRPEDWPVVALVFGSVFPDLIDKPLAWEFGAFETGYALAHSVFFAVPLSIAVLLVAKRYGREREGAAFAIGYLLHLVGDVLPASLSRNALYLRPVLWPFATHQSGVDRGSFSEGVTTLLRGYVEQLLTTEVTAVVALQVGSVVFGVTLWILDGRPGLALVRGAVRRAVGRGRSR